MVDMVTRPESRDSARPIILQPRECQRQKVQRNLEVSRKKERRQPAAPR
jgi:hypothetical protein